MVWGVALRSGADTPGVDRQSFAVFFALGIAFCALTLWLLRRLPDTRAGMQPSGA
jgi:hypothetical protein